METYIIIFLFLVIVSMLYGILNILKKLEYYEEFIINRKEKYQQLLNTIKEIDSKELFEKDDDVGSVFTQIKEEIESFENILN